MVSRLSILSFVQPTYTIQKFYNAMLSVLSNLISTTTELVITQEKEIFNKCI